MMPKVGGKRQASQSSSRKAREKVLKTFWQVSLISVPAKIMEQIPLEAISKHMKGKKMAGKKQDGFAQSKLCLTSLIALCDERTGSVHKGRVVDALCQ